MENLLSRPLTILAVGAHPDDLEVLCAGTLAKCARRGDHVSMAVATDGSAGHMAIPPAELVVIRREEAEQSASVIGADFHWLGFPDELILEDVRVRLRFVDLIRITRPDVILTHDPGDYHPDHRAVSHLVFAASFIAGLPNIRTSQPAHPRVRPLFYFDTLMGANFVPTEYVDVSDTFETKVAMMNCHKSQLQWLEEHDEVSPLDFIEVMARSRGLQCGARYAEGFRPELAWGRPRPYRLLP